MNETFENILSKNAYFVLPKVISTIQELIGNPVNSDYWGSGLPLWITGGKNEERTRLLKWVLSELNRKHSKLNVKYCNAYDFVEIINTGNIDGFQEKYADVDFLLLDNAQYLASCPAIEDEFFKMYCHMTERNAPIFIAADASFKNLGFNVRLMTRFAVGAEVSLV